MFTLKQKSQNLVFSSIMTLIIVIIIIYYLEVNDSVQLVVGSKEKTTVHIMAFIMNYGSLCWTKNVITSQHVP